MALGHINYKQFRHGAKRYMNLTFKIVESIDKQTSDNQNNKRVKKNNKFYK